MNDKKKLFLMVLFLGLVCTTIFQFVIQNYTWQLEGSAASNDEIPSPCNGIPHGPIFIDSNGDFEDLNFPGSGTSGDPYLIVNYIIMDYTTNLIHIQDTTAHFIIRNCYLDGLQTRHINGINLLNVQNGIIEENYIQNCGHGIRLYNSVVNFIYGNTVSGNDYGLYLYSSDYNQIHENTVSGKYYGIHVSNSRYNEISHNIVSGNSYGIDLFSSKGNIIWDNDVSGNDYGIDLSNSINNDIDDNTVSGSIWGIRLLHSSDYNQIHGNTVSGNHYGLDLYNSDYNQIHGNTVSGNDFGIDVSNSRYNEISHNIVSGNSYGIDLFSSDNNMIWENICDNEILNAFDDGVNFWDDSIIGNYWGDYIGIDADHDGIGDTPYDIFGGNNRDYKPIYQDIEPVIDIISPSEGLITNQDVVLTYVVSDDISAPEDIVITGPASGTTYTTEGYYNEIITATDEAGNTATASVSFIIDKTVPEITIIGPPEGCYNTDQTVTWSVSDPNLDINSIDANYPELWTFDTEGTYQVEVSACDLAGNFATASSAQFVIDKTNPITSIEFDTPYFEINDKIHLTSATPLELKPLEIPGGSGIYKTYFRIFNDTYDSGVMLYTGLFTLDYSGLYDGSYNLEYYSIDFAGNSEDPNSKGIVLDKSPPKLNWQYEGYALQDGFIFEIEALDLTEVSSVSVSIRELNGPVLVDIPVIYMGENQWQAVESFDTTTLPDGYYELLVSATDKFGFTTDEVFSFSIRNWAVLVLLPSTESNKAGRTMPVKFALRVVEEVDPNMPFVVNQELDIFITDTATGEILQHSTYGDTSKDYRINELTEHYITNFKTHRTPTIYSVNIYRKDFFIGEFSFTTVK